MWRAIRLAVLLLALAVALITTWYDRSSTTDWEETLWIGIFPVSADGDAVTDQYISRLTTARFTDVERFLTDEAHDYGVALTRPVRVDLYPEIDEPPPELEPGSNVFARMWWSLKLRLYARSASRSSGRPPPQIRVFVLYHNPEHTQAAPHSVGLQKGLVGVVHAFADADMTGANNVVIAHEILHTLGATDKYDLSTLAPIYPAGYADPEREPLLPQDHAEIMAGRRPIDRDTFEMPESLRSVIVGPETAAEVGWISAP